ncbi:MAG: hypothetical protein AAGD10_15085 [Myxococcota bacterium]
MGAGFGPSRSDRGPGRLVRVEEGRDSLAAWALRTRVEQTPRANGGSRETEDRWLVRTRRARYRGLVNLSRLLLFAWMLGASGNGLGKEGAVPAVESQIAGALLAAPEDMRAEATVMAYASEGELEVVRNGSNTLICLASPPTKPSFQAACYHRDLEPFMARGRALRKEGVTGEENKQQRWKEVESGALPMPRAPRTLHVLVGSSFDPKTKTVADPYRRWVVYIPFATASSTGLSTKPSLGVPWLMHPGTAGAHIMITPPRTKAED